MISATLAILLSVTNLFSWGLWPLIRLNCKADGPVFFILYLLGQWTISFIIAVTNNPHLFAVNLAQVFAPHKIIAIILGGYCAANGDFLCSCACTRIPVSIAFPVYAGICLVLGISLSYVVERGQGSKPLLLFTGLGFALVAVISLALAEAHSHDSIQRSLHQKSLRKLALEQAEAEEQQLAQQMVQTSDVVPMKLLKKSKKKETFMDSLRLIFQQMDNWVYVCMMAGIIAALWSPMSSIARIQPNPVKDPSTLLFLFQTGQLIAMPMILSYYGGIIIVLEKKCPPVSPIDYLEQAWKLPLKDKFWGILTGSLVGIGYGCYFISSNIIAPTIALGIASCEPLATIILGVVFANQLAGTTPWERFYMLQSTVAFIIAIILMTFSGQ